MPPVEGLPPLVRRLAVRPREVATPRPEFVCGGPYQLSGGWWQGEVRRSYCFVRVGSGGLRWVYRDWRRDRWRLHGVFE